MTVFDPGALNRLVDDAPGRVFALELARTFQRLLAPRVERVVAAFDGDDHEELMDAVLSLRVSCSMLGAHELAELAREVEGDIRRGDRPAARALATMMPCAASQLDGAIERYLAAAVPEPAA